MLSPFMIAKWVKYFQKAWALFKNAVTQALLECSSQIRKCTTIAKRMPAWLMSKVKAAIRGNKHTDGGDMFNVL